MTSDKLDEFRRIVDACAAAGRDPTPSECRHLDALEAEIKRERGADPVARGLDATGKMLALRESAGDREFKVSQVRGYDAAATELRAVAEQLGSAHLRALARNLDDPDVVAEFRRQLAMTRAIAGASSFDSNAEHRVERAAGDATMDIGRLFNEARARGRAEYEFESRALQSSGGSAISQTFSDRVWVYERTAAPVLDVCTLLTTETGGDIVLPRLTTDPSYGGTVVAEAAGIGTADPTISSVTLGSFKYANITLWSAELDTDNVIGLEDLVARSTARELSIDIGAHLTTGDGTNKPRGYITAATVAGTASGTAVVGGDNFIDWQALVAIYHTLAAPYRANATWLVSPTALAKIAAFKDTTGRPLFAASMYGGLSDLLLGRPVREDPNLATLGSASKSVAVGDFRGYAVRRLPLRVELSREYAFVTDQVALKTVERIDGDLVDEASIKVLQSANT